MIEEQDAIASTPGGMWILAERLQEFEEQVRLPAAPELQMPDAADAGSAAEPSTERADPGQSETRSVYLVSGHELSLAPAANVAAALLGRREDVLALKTEIARSAMAAGLKYAEYLWPGAMDFVEESQPLLRAGSHTPQKEPRASRIQVVFRFDRVRPEERVWMSGRDLSDKTRSPYSGRTIVELLQDRRPDIDDLDAAVNEWCADEPLRPGLTPTDAQSNVRRADACLNLALFWKRDEICPSCGMTGATVRICGDSLFGWRCEPCDEAEWKVATGGPECPS